MTLESLFSFDDCWRLEGKSGGKNALRSQSVLYCFMILCFTAQMINDFEEKLFVFARNFFRF
jgi:hypothetical protein